MLICRVGKKTSTFRNFVLAHTKQDKLMCKCLQQRSERLGIDYWWTYLCVCVQYNHIVSILPIMLAKVKYFDGQKITKEKDCKCKCWLNNNDADAFSTSRLLWSTIDIFSISGVETRPLNQAQAFAYRLEHDLWNISSCQEDIVILYSTDDQAVSWFLFFGHCPSLLHWWPGCKLILVLCSLSFFADCHSLIIGVLCSLLFFTHMLTRLWVHSLFIVVLYSPDDQALSWLLFFVHCHSLFFVILC